MIPIQAAVSALLVLVLGPATAGAARLVDVGVGAAVGPVFSQFLLTSHPVRAVENAAHVMLEALAQGFSQAVEALNQRDPQRAQAALDQLVTAHRTLVGLSAAVAAARMSARWTLRGHLLAREVSDTADRFEGWAVRLYAATLLFGETLANVLQGDDPTPRWLAERMERVAAVCASLARATARRDGLPHPGASTLTLAPQHWQACAERLCAVEEALDAFAPPSGRPSTGAVGRSAPVPNERLVANEASIIPDGSSSLVKPPILPR